MPEQNESLRTPEERIKSAQILYLCELGLLEGDIDGKRINEENLARLNKANILAQQIFPNAKFENKLRKNSSSSESIVVVDAIEFEKKHYPKDADRADNFAELIKLVDYISIDGVEDNKLMIYFSIKGVWEE